MPEGEASSWRALIDRYHSTLVDDLGLAIDAELRAAAHQAAAIARAEGDLRVVEARAESERMLGEARKSAADSLHQAIRRLRQCTSELQTLKLLNELCASAAPQSVVLVFENNQARAAALRGLAPEDVGPSLVFEITAAPAVMSAIETRDPVIALLSARELSEPLAAALGVEPGSRAYLFPILVRQSVVAILVASGAVSTPQMELLCDVTAMRLEALAPPPPAPAIGLVQIAASPASAASAAGTTVGVPDKLAWEDLSTDDQRLHLQAQRMARVRTAEMRLYHSDDLQRGLSSGDVYAALQSQLDAARNEFLQAYLSKSSTMVDYLHLEVIRTLVHDNDALLGPGYPGPMV